MCTRRSKITCIISGIASICLSGVAWANDVWPSNFDWESPQTLTRDSAVTFSWHFNATSGHYQDCTYNVSLYLSSDTSFSKAGDHPFYTYHDTVSAGTIWFDASVTLSSDVSWPLPPDGLYYVFLELQPGNGAPSDSDPTNDVVMDPNPIQVKTGMTAHTGYSGGTGEPNDPYRIATPEDLMLLGETPEDYDRHFVLTADIDLDPNLPGRKVFDKAVIAPQTFEVIGYFQGTPFTGAFDGAGHTIWRLTIVGEDFLGLFGRLDVGARILNLGLNAVAINGTGPFVGGLAGGNTGSITASYATGAVTGSEFVGGLAGGNTGSITASHGAGAVTGSRYVGGLVGGNTGSITGSYGTGAVTGSEFVGGLVGWNFFDGNTDGTITASHSSGTIRGDRSVGGLTGENWASTTASYSTGAVTGSEYIGGLVGSNGGDVNNCYSTAVVSGGSEVAGLVGNNGGALTKCYSTGAVDGNDTVGGLIGLNKGNVTRCYSTGPVDGNENVGGLVGDNWGRASSVANCYSTSMVSGESQVGGLVGLNYDAIVSKCYSIGAVDGNSDVGGLVGSNVGDSGSVADCFWDVETSDRTASSAGAGRTTAEMQNVSTFLNAGWDFVGETDNGAEDIWVMRARGYPQLSWMLPGLASAVSVHRLWSPTYSTHFYTIDESEKDDFLNDPLRAWQYEGVAFYAFADANAPGLLPVHRFYLASLNAYFYTISEPEKDYLIANFPNVWTYQGIAFYAFPEGQQPAGALPVYRFWSPVGNSHFYTISEIEKDFLLREFSHIWTLEGIAWYAYPF